MILHRILTQRFVYHFQSRPFVQYPSIPVRSDFTCPAYFSSLPFRPHFTAFLSAFAFCLPFSIILIRSVFNHPRSFRLSSLYYHSGGCDVSPFLCVRLSVDKPFSQLLFLVGGCTLQIHCQLFGLINFCHFFNFSTFQRIPLCHILRLFRLFQLLDFFESFNFCDFFDFSSF